MVTKEVSKRSWTALLEYDQLHIRLSVEKQRIIFRLSSQLFFEQQRTDILENVMSMDKALKNMASYRKLSLFQPFWHVLTNFNSSVGKVSP